MISRPVILIQNACVDMFVDVLKQNLNDTDLLLPSRVWMLVLVMQGAMRTLSGLIPSLCFDSIVVASDSDNY